MEGRVYRENEADLNEWDIRGEPNLQLKNDQAPYRFTTRSSVINRIPDVINPKPSLVSLDGFGKPSYKHGNPGGYIN
jgi:hypothetical protein